MEIPFSEAKEDNINFPESGIFNVKLTKLTEASTFGTGIGSEVLSPSTFKFYGLILDENSSLLELSPKTRKMEFIGASDTAGFCVDGNTSMGIIDYGLEGWKYYNCE